MFLLVNSLIVGMAVGGLAEVLLCGRKIPRAEWLLMFERWVAPSSNSEEIRMKNTEVAVREAIERSFGTVGNGLKFILQGSSTNNTNVRNRSDLDLIVVAEFENWLLPNSFGNFPVGTVPSGRSMKDTYPLFRQRVYRALQNSEKLLMSVNINNKVIKLSPNSSARVECDVLPAFRVSRQRDTLNYLAPATDQGVIFITGSGKQIHSFPEQHLTNGKRKNNGTGYRYKQIVRILKKLRDRFDKNSTLLTAQPLPSSYQIECLVYNVPDRLLSGGDLYDAVLASASWIHNALCNGHRCDQLYQVNGIHSVFSHWGGGILGELGKSDDVDYCDNFITQVINEVGA